MGAEDRRCQEEDCHRAVYARGWCGMHYKRWLRTGSPVRGERPSACAVDGCERQAKTRGWCHAHYQRWRATGDVQAHVPIRRTRTCSIEGCERRHQARDLCSSHYQRVRQHGDIQLEVPIGQLPRPQRDGPRRARGWRANGYRYVPVPDEDLELTGGQSFEAEHRLVMARMLGRPLDADENVHHRNGDRLDNRPENLELWSVSQPAGQRVSDKIAHAEEVLGRYAPERLAGQVPTDDGPSTA